MKTIDQYVRESEDHEIGAAFLLALYDQVKPANSGFAPEDVDRLRRRGFILKELAKGPHADMCRVGHELMPPTYRCKKTVHVKDLLSDAHYWEVTVGQDDRGVGAATTDIVEEHAKRKHPTNYALTEEYRQEQALREYDLDKRKHMRKLR
jgi:hypothetical protein